MNSESSPFSRLRGVLEDFVDDLNRRLTVHELEEVLDENVTRRLTSDDLGLDDSDFTGYAPERWTESHLIDDILDAMRLDWEPQPYGRGQADDVAELAEFIDGEEAGLTDD